MAVSFASRFSYCRRFVVRPPKKTRVRAFGFALHRTGGRQSWVVGMGGSCQCWRWFIGEFPFANRYGSPPCIGGLVGRGFAADYFLFFYPREKRKRAGWSIFSV